MQVTRGQGWGRSSLWPQKAHRGEDTPPIQQSWLSVWQAVWGGGWKCELCSWLGLTFCICPLLAMWTWAIYFTSLSLPQFPHLQRGNNERTYLAELRRLAHNRGKIFETFSLAHCEDPVDVGYYFITKYWDSNLYTTPPEARALVWLFWCCFTCGRGRSRKHLNSKSSWLSGIISYWSKI